MIIIGDDIIACDTIEKIESLEDIKSTTPNSTLLFRYDKNMMDYCMKNDLSYAVSVENITQLIYANSLYAKYIIPNSDILEVSQSLADNYMFDSKILATIKFENEIENIALKHIDGVIYKAYLLI
ncbi:MAG: hypothetical protein U9R37_05365 [Campylobacterota bacterium]|nr:hypothetical protein [Campylobacterota bacterium]